MGHIEPLQQSGAGKIITASPAAGLASRVPNNSSARSDLTMRTHDITHAVAVIPRGHRDQAVFCIGSIYFSRDGMQEKILHQFYRNIALVFRKATP
jgi:hypothetical protein